MKFILFVGFCFCLFQVIRCVIDGVSLDKMKFVVWLLLMCFFLYPLGHYLLYVIDDGVFEHGRWIEYKNKRYYESQVLIDVERLEKEIGYIPIFMHPYTGVYRIKNMNSEIWLAVHTEPFEQAKLYKYKPVQPENKSSIITIQEFQPNQIEVNVMKKDGTSTHVTKSVSDPQIMQKVVQAQRRKSYFMPQNSKTYVASLRSAKFPDMTYGVTMLQYQDRDYIQFDGGEGFHPLSKVIFPSQSSR